jgi:hypothetical protein
MKEKHLADLRNQLSPIFNYFEMLRHLDSLKANNERSFRKSYNISELEGLIESEKLKCEGNVKIIGYLLTKLEEDETK